MSWRNTPPQSSGSKNNPSKKPARNRTQVDQSVLPKSSLTFNGPYGVISRKIELLMNTKLIRLFPFYSSFPHPQWKGRRRIPHKLILESTIYAIIRYVRLITFCNILLSCATLSFFQNKESNYRSSISETALRKWRPSIASGPVSLRTVIVTSSASDVDILLQPRCPHPSSCTDEQRFWFP
jgi:hypothetical protein